MDYLYNDGTKIELGDEVINVTTINKIIENYDYDYNICISKLESLGKLKEINHDESIIEFSIDVEWESNYELEIDGDTFEIHFDGVATAEISYDRWVNSFNHEITDWKVKIKG